MATHSQVWTAILHSSATAVTVGYAVVKRSDDKYVVATTANRASYGRSVGIARTAADTSNPAFELQEGGFMPNSLTSLGSGAESWVRVSATGSLERVTPGAGDDLIGKCNARGDLFVQPGVWDSDNYEGGGGGGSTPTGTGFRHVTAGTEDAATKLVENADVHASAAIAISKLAPIAASDIASGTLVHERGGLEADVSAYSGLVKITGGTTSAVSIDSAVQTWIGNPSSANLASAVTGETGSGALVFANTPTLITPKIEDSSGGQTYNIVVSNLAANRNVTLPLLGADDTFVFAAFAQSLTNKTINANSNTLTATVNTLGALLKSDGTSYVGLAVGSADQVLVANSTPDATWAKIVNANVDNAAAIAGTKISPAFAAAVSGLYFAGTGNLNNASTGTLNNVSTTGAMSIRFTNATAPTITGLDGGTHGRLLLLTFVNGTPSNGTLNAEDAGSTAANRIVLDETSPTRNVWAGASILVWYDGQSSRWRELCALAA